MTGTVTRTEAVACDRGDLSTGIVHFGVGGFHRSHQQVSFQDLQFGITRGCRADEPRAGAVHRPRRAERARYPSHGTPREATLSARYPRPPTREPRADPSVSRPPNSSQQAYTDDLLRQDFDAAKDWCYTGVGVLEWDAKMRDYLKNNDWRYPIVAREGTDVDAMDMRPRGLHPPRHAPVL